MNSSSRSISLGFASDNVPEGTHLCLIFTDEQERVDSLLKFLLSGLQEGERCACFSDYLSEDEIRDFLIKEGISYDESKEKGAIYFSKTTSVYFQEGTFSPERMLNRLETFYQDALSHHYPGARVIGEMTPEVETTPGGDRLLEYESRVSLLVRKYPITAVCQYDARNFDGATIMEVLKVHPKMLLNGTVVNNPFFIEPEEYLKSCCNGAH